MSAEDAKKAILARRARFLAAAMVSAGATAGCDEGRPPFACLSPRRPSEPLGYAVPSLSAPLPPPMVADAGTSIDDASAAPPALPDAEPPRPHPCLRVPPPPRDAGPKPRLP